MVRAPLSCASQEPLIIFYDPLTPKGGWRLGDLRCAQNSSGQRVPYNAITKTADIVETSSQEIAVTLECQDSANEASRPLRVLLFCEKWESGGVEAFVTTLLECMDRTGLVVDVAACKVQPGPYDIRLAKMGIEPIALGASIRDVASNLKAFRRLLERGAYDAVHLNVYEGLALLFAREAKRAGVARVIVHSHNNDLRPSATRWLKLALHRMCAGLLGGYADARWAPSQAAGRFMFGKRPFTLVRNGIVPERFAFDAGVRKELRAKLGFASNQAVLGCVGRLCDQKNQLFLVDVLAAMPQNTRLLLVGEDDGDGSYEAALRRRACELGVQDRLCLHGRTDDVASLYQAMDVLCVPSTFEALGIVAVEGQAAGLPVVASIAVPPEAHAGGRFNQAQLDPDAWASALTDALAQHHDRSQAWQAVSRSGYDMREVATEVLRGYGAVAPSRGKVSKANATQALRAPGIDRGLVSIVVPVHNVAEYVGECLESLRTQTYRNIEVVVVDDGSSDDSGAICDATGATDPRFKVVHQVNAGLSAARNAGIEMAKGEWIAFVDSDDTVSPCFVEALLIPGADISQCMFTCDSDELVASSDLRCAAFKARTGREASLALQLDSTGAATVAWNKLYRASLFEGVRFPVGRQHEDEFVTYRLLWRAGSVAVCDVPFYFYRQRSGSIMDSGVTVKTPDAFEALEKRIAFYRAEGDEELACLSEAVLCNRIGSSLEDLAGVSPDDAKAWGCKRDTLLRHLLSSSYIPAKKKLALLLQRVCPGLYTRAKGC